MNEHPILFSTPMVKAILEGRKTQTRRIIKPQPKHGFLGFIRERLTYWFQHEPTSIELKCPYGQPGDHLWVRETWAGDESTGFAYKASEPFALPFGEECIFDKWKPSIHMPRKASRITLEVVNVRVERLSNISEEDIRAEGTPTPNPPPNNWMDDSKWRATFAYLWDFINEKRGFSWESNPWVWVVEFKRIH